MLRRLCFVAVGISVLLFSSGRAFAKGHDIVKFNKDIEVSRDMTVNDVVAIGGNITVYGRVENNVVSVGGSVALADGSYVGQQVVIIGGELLKDPDAVVAGKITQVYIPHFIPSLPTFLKGGWLALWTTISVLALFGFLGLSVLLAALIPEHMGTVVNALEKSFFIMVLWGILGMILIIPTAALLAISIIGIVLIPLEVLLVVLALIIGYIAAAAYIGKNILLSFNKFPPPFVDVIIGIVLLFLIGFIPIAGTIIKTIFLAAGFGAVITTKFGTAKRY